MAVFRRDPNYDTNQDAVVRNAAAEVRKRLAQYYQETQETADLRVDLAPGSYVPQFLPVTPAEESAAAPPAPRRRHIAPWHLISGVVALGVLLAAAWMMERRASHADLDHFWAPITEADETVQICVGQPNWIYGFDHVPSEKIRAGAGVDADSFLSLKELRPVETYFLYVGDAFSMARVGAYLQQQRVPYQLRTGSPAPYFELRGKPLVLIGAHNNPWTMRLTSSLRFYFDHTLIRDRQNHDRVVATGVTGLPVDDWEDYAIVTRMQVPAMERTILCAAGVSHKGTLAAGEFITGASYMREAVRNAPSGWYRKNIQFVLRIRVVGGTPGPPAVVAAHYW